MGCCYTTLSSSTFFSYETQSAPRYLPHDFHRPRWRGYSYSRRATASRKTGFTGVFVADWHVTVSGIHAAWSTDCQLSDHAIFRIAYFGTDVGSIRAPTSLGCLARRNVCGLRALCSGDHHAQYSAPLCIAHVGRHHRRKYFRSAGRDCGCVDAAESCEELRAHRRRVRTRVHHGAVFGRTTGEYFVRLVVQCGYAVLVCCLSCIHQYLFHPAPASRNKYATDNGAHRLGEVDSQRHSCVPHEGATLALHCELRVHQWIFFLHHALWYFSHSAVLVQ